VVFVWGDNQGTVESLPDAFYLGPQNVSHGNLEYNFSLTAATSYGRSAVEAGMDILDIYSTRPGSGLISPDEEMKRTIPIIQAIRKYKENLRQIPISVDTVLTDVAEAATWAGRNCINDVYALTGPYVGVANVSVDGVVKDKVSDGGVMLRTATRIGVPVILMHSRGPTDKNKNNSMCSESVMEGGKG